MPNYSVTFDDGKTILVWAADKSSAKAKAQARYKRKKGKSGRITKVD
jgi:hypothetical protein